jgi:hypothetical protein
MRNTEKVMPKMVVAKVIGLNKTNNKKKLRIIKITPITK